ncbi:hypothetical protein TRIUR3_14699 [Triticum urartu]|uniref:Uncharacterized protein n=1 Tax=Triticum urartu TaxID=4572 RepID=M7ZWD5_TRIUA|nr:hypothetical protein TRIUR3_14699 [Triticum urartu]
MGKMLDKLVSTIQFFSMDAIVKKANSGLPEISMGNILYEEVIRYSKNPYPYLFKECFLLFAGHD